MEFRRDLAYLWEENAVFSEAVEQLRRAAYLGDGSALKEFEGLER